MDAMRPYMDVLWAWPRFWLIATPLRVWRKNCFGVQGAGRRRKYNGRHSVSVRSGAWAGGQKFVCMCVCDFLLDFTTNGVCVENVFTWSLNRPTRGEVQAPLLVPNYLMGTALAWEVFAEFGRLSAPATLFMCGKFLAKCFGSVGGGTS